MDAEEVMEFIFLVDAEEVLVQSMVLANGLEED